MMELAAGHLKATSPAADATQSSFSERTTPTSELSKSREDSSSSSSSDSWKLLGDECARLSSSPGISGSGSCSFEIPFDTLGLILKPAPCRQFLERNLCRGHMAETMKQSRSIEGLKPTVQYLRRTTTCVLPGAPSCSWLRQVVVVALLCWLATAVSGDDAAPGDEKTPRSSGSSGLVPNISEQPVSQTLSRHAVTTVTCGVSPPSAQVRWLYNGQPLDHRRHPGLEMLDNGLRFLALLAGLDGEDDLWENELARAARPQTPGTSGGVLTRHGNEGEYRCTATTAAGSVVSQPAVLSLPVLERFPPGENLTLEVPEGGYVTLPCSGPYSVPAAELLIVGPGGTPLRDGRFRGAEVRRLPSGAVILSQLGPAVAGNYSCVAVNNALGKNETSPYVINVAVNKSIPESPPSVRFLRGPRRTVRAVLGSSVTLECPTYGPARPHGSDSDVSGYSQGPGVVWAREGGSLPPGRFKIDRYGNLVLRSVDSLDAGTYVCSESHAEIVGTQGLQSDHAGDSHPPSAAWVDRPEVSLEMLTSPVARIVTPLEDAALVGEAVKLSCFVGGYPAPVIAWYHNGRRLEEADMSETVVLPQVTLADAGLYQCMVTNEVGSAQGVARLRVREMPVRRDKEEVDVSVEKEDKMNMNLGPAGGRPSRRRDRKKHGRRRDMRVKDRRKKKNQQKFGYAEGREKPKYAPSVPKVEQLSDRSVKLSWTVQDKGNGQTIKFFKVQYKEMSPQKTEWKTSDPQLPFNTRDFEVSGLKSGGLYKFRVLAVYEDNDNKNSANTNVFELKVQTAAHASAPDTAPVIVEVTAVMWNGQHGLALKWQYKAESASPIEGFIIFYKPFGSEEDYESQTFPDAGIRNHVLQGLAPNTDYTIRMKSFNSEGESDFSNRVNGKTKPTDPSLEPMLPHVPHHPMEPPPTDSPETERQQRNSDSLGQPIILVIAIGVLVSLLIPLVVICLCKYWRQKRRSLGSNSQQKFQEQAQCFLAPGADSSSMKPNQSIQQQQHQQINGGLYPSATNMGSGMAGSSGGQGHSHMNLGVNPLAEYDVQTSGGGGPGPGHPKQYYPNGGVNGLGSRYGSGEPHPHPCNNNACQHPHMAAHGDMAYMEQQQQMHPMQQRTLPSAPTPHSFYSEAGSLGRMPAHSTSTVNHDYSEPGDHEVLLQQKQQRPGIPMSSSGLSHHPSPPQQPPQPPPPLLTHQPQQQQYPFYNHPGGMLDMMGPSHGPQLHSHPHNSNSGAPFMSNKSNSSGANPSGNSRYYESSWAGSYDQPHAADSLDGAPNSGTLGRGSAINSSNVQRSHPGPATSLPGSYVPTSSSSSSSSYSPSKPADYPSSPGAVVGPTSGGLHPQTMMPPGHHMRFAPPAHPHRRPGGREGLDGAGGGKHHRRRKKRPHGREHQPGGSGGQREMGMKDQATNTDLSSNEGGFEFTTFAQGTRAKTSSVGGSSQSASEGEGQACGSGSEVEDVDQAPGQDLYHYCDSSFANHGSTESLEGIAGQDSNSGPGSSDEEEPLNHPDLHQPKNQHHHHPQHHHHQHHHHHPHHHQNNKHHHHYHNRHQQTSPTSPSSSTYQAIFPTPSSHVAPVPL